MAWLLLFQAAGEVLARALGLPFPGPVVGMLLLLGGLAVPTVRAAVRQCADFLLAHLSLLFVPVGVGVLAHLDVVASYGGRMLVVILLSTWAGMIATFWTLGRLMRGDGPGEDVGDVPASDASPDRRGEATTVSAVEPHALAPQPRDGPPEPREDLQPPGPPSDRRVI